MPIKKLGLWTSSSLVVGNMIGSGIFLLPSALAHYGSISIFGWIFSATGAILLAKVFSKLSKKLPKAGGPYAYTRHAFGDFAAFLIAWGYWISIWCGNAAITVALISYLSVFFPILSTNNFLALVCGLSMVWLLTWVNVKGVRTAGKVQLITTILKLTPIILIISIGLFYIDIKNFTPFNLTNDSFLSILTATSTLTLWAFLGLESATVPAENIKEPDKIIPKATLIGTLVTTMVYVLSSIIIMGIIPATQLQGSNAPFADAASKLFGSTAHYIVAGAAVLSCFGALNGWLLLQGQIPLAASKDKLFPPIFNRIGKNGTPIFGMIISSALISCLLMMNFTKGLVETFKFIILLSTLSVLIPYLFSTAAYGILVLREKTITKVKITTNLILAFTAFLFSLWAIAGSGQESVYWGFILLLSGIPFYALLKNK